MVKCILVKSSRISDCYNRTRNFMTRSFGKLYYKDLFNIFQLDRQTLLLGCSKSYCVFFNRWRCPRLLVCERDMNVYARLLLTLNLKTKKKVDAIWSSFVLAIVVRTWRILKNIFTIFCFITSKKGKKATEARKSCIEQKCRQKTPVPELVCPIP